MDGRNVAVMERSITLPAPLVAVRDAMTRPGLMQAVCAPILRFRLIHPPAWPDRFGPGAYAVQVRFLGVLPPGRQVINISFPPCPEGQFLMRDNGHAALIARWDHRLTAIADGTGRTRYTDRVEIEAGWKTALVAAFARALFAHRQRRLHHLATTGFAGI
ncbi:hypothetical protein KUL25_03040 [Rhodobacteraceae bacterium N5(2021)]|uniref:Uncharacterized protein n=1 Tax=Gymnodinialimonas phycosphaerae TaxID=2841589 RepID=A0A975TWL5_9RHOB|nr:hypothetical protein [Gymnodinialimonas phycosphaerae]MBY4891738.1 hypothetical protein [Gymnodinialimonas phycosphaerae]